MAIKSGLQKFSLNYSARITLFPNLVDMKPEETVDFHLRWCWHKIARMYNTQAAPYGATMSAGLLLLNVDKNGTPSTSLGPKMGMEPRSLTRILRSLEEDGYIYRKVDNHDRRKVLICLTEKGKKFRNISKGVVLNFNEKVRETIDPAKLETFFEVMSQIDQVVESMETTNSKRKLKALNKDL